MPHAKTQRRKGEKVLPFFASLRLCVSLFCTLCFLILGIPLVQAHEDPNGDVYPTVLIENGNFSVLFFTNFYESAEGALEYFPDERKPWFRTTISSEGKILQYRQAFPVISRNISPGNWQPEDGILAFDAESVFSTLRPRTLQGVPWKEIIWPGRFIITSGDWATLFDSYLYSHITSTGFPIWKEETEYWPFYIAKIDPITGIVCATAEIGNPSRIYASAAASEVRIIDGKAYIAWLWKGHVSTNTDTITVTRLVLSRWNPTTGQTDHFFQPDSIDWNTHLSMNAIGKNLLIAWHVGRPTHTPNSRVMTRFIRTEDLLPNTSQLFPSIAFGFDFKQLLNP